jgi:hypothetical protein
VTSELVYRMRTCAAALLDSRWRATPPTMDDAAALLTEASNLLDEPDCAIAQSEPLGEPMPKLEPAQVVKPGTSVTWTTLDLPDVKPRPCPFCGNVSARTARITDRRLMLSCPMCSQTWEYRP